MSQYVVTFFGDETLAVTVVGPFRTRDRAETMRKFIDGYDTSEGPAKLPQVVRLLSKDEFIYATERPYSEGDKTP